MHQSTTKPERLTLDTIESPIGSILLATDADGVLRALVFADGQEDLHRLLRLQYGSIDLEHGESPSDVRANLTAYFAGDLDALGRIPWDTGGTPFQRSVWTALTDIPAGTTMTYGALAAGIGAPRAVRAVGHANGANPISWSFPATA